MAAVEGGFATIANVVFPPWTPSVGRVEWAPIGRRVTPPCATRRCRVVCPTPSAGRFAPSITWRGLTGIVGFTIP